MLVCIIFRFSDVVICIRKSEITENNTGKAIGLTKIDVIQDCSLVNR